MFFEVLAAEIHDSGHLSVNWVEAELFVMALLPVASCLYWQRQLEGLQEPRLVIVKVSDAIHRHAALSSRKVKTVQWVLSDKLWLHHPPTAWTSKTKEITNSQRNLCIITYIPTLLRVRGATYGVLSRGDSLGVSDVELRDELLLESSLLASLKLEVRWRKDSINSVGSLCPSLWGSCRCLCVRSLDMTCDSGMPNTWGVTSAWGERARQEAVKFIFLASSQLGDVELLLICVIHVSMLYILLSGACVFCTKCLKLRVRCSFFISL